MIFSITKYKKKENLDIHDYRKFQLDSKKMKEVLILIEVVLGLSSVGIVRGVVHEV